MTHPLLLAPVRPPTHPLIDLRCASCEDPQFLADAAGADLVLADPNWLYDQRIAEGAAEDHYKGDPIDVQANRLHAFGLIAAAPGAACVVRLGRMG